jgi:cell division protein ZapE
MSKPTASAAPVPAANLSELYQRELKRHQLHSDAAQLGAVEQLERLRVQLLQEHAARGKSAPLSRLLGRKAVRPATRGLYLWGGVGRGKTWLMDIFYEALADVPRQRQHFHHFMRDVHTALGKLKQQRDPLPLVAAKLARDMRVLCLDELYVSDIADAMILGGLLEALLANDVALIITSNAAPGQLYQDGLQRARFLPAIKLLESKLRVHELKGSSDFRLRQLRRAAIYLIATDLAQSRAALGELFMRLVGTHGEHGTTLRIANRPLAAWRRSSDVVWFGFDALCLGARSQNDYIEIAAQFHTVFLSDVPRFDAHSEDAARRFIALVDEFYDQGVKLVLSAAAAPTELYGGERLQFEFRRTASRLMEMQSEQYLAREHRRRSRP